MREVKCLQRNNAEEQEGQFLFNKFVCFHLQTCVLIVSILSQHIKKKKKNYREHSVFVGVKKLVEHFALKCVYAFWVLLFFFFHLHTHTIISLFAPPNHPHPSSFLLRDFNGCTFPFFFALIQCNFLFINITQISSAQATQSKMNAEGNSKIFFISFFLLSILSYCFFALYSFSMALSPA